MKRDARLRSGLVDALILYGATGPQAVKLAGEILEEWDEMKRRPVPPVPAESWHRAIGLAEVLVVYPNDDGVVRLAHALLEALGAGVEEQ